MVAVSVAPAVGVVVVAASERLAAAAGLTVTARPLPLSLEPSLTVIEIDSALYSFIVPLAVPAAKRRVGTLPKFTATPDLSVKGGWKLPNVVAPPKVRLLSPVWPVAVLP